ncbi:DUF1651 domain-containing protein [Synechococcus sp. A15-127]|uniref:DUF1651 domain-containing protein n=1 Tax=Synechococcus sp. A15-127 TaxID=1050624 RepID=UPI0016478BEB|nr:DUF1651 domain-containing protein [Synechococcus sp. A15-127]
MRLPSACIPPRQPVPQTRRRMLRDNAIEAWNTMKITGWLPCHLPVRYLSQRIATALERLRRR